MHSESSGRNWFGKRPERRAARSRRALCPNRRPRGLEGLEDRNLLTGVTATFAVTNGWGSGFQGDIHLSNSQATSVPNWQLQFDFNRKLTSIWDAAIVSHVNDHYVIRGAAWDSTLAAGGTLDFGFVGSGSGATAAPTNFVVNGVPVGKPLPSLSIGDVSKAEGNSGTTSFLFTVTLSAAATTPVTVGYSTADGTAQAGSDYRAASGTLSFAAGQTSQVVTVGVTGDTTVEPDETFSLKLANSSGATLARAPPPAPSPTTTPRRPRATSRFRSAPTGAAVSPARSR